MKVEYLFLATDNNKMQLYHLLLNAVNFKEKGHDVAVVLECASPKILVGIADQSIKLPFFDKTMELEIIDHARKACSAAFSATEATIKLGVPPKGELSRHSNLLPFAERGLSAASENWDKVGHRLDSGFRRLVGV